MILDGDTVSRVVFHPRSEPPTYVPQGVATMTPSDGAEIAGYLHVCSTSPTLVIFFHGNGELAANYDQCASIFLNCGVSYWVVDYRGYGRSTGTPSCTAMFKDADAILADISRLGQAVNQSFQRVIVMGRSLGSASAIHLAAMGSPSVVGLVLDSAYADDLALIARLGGPNIQKDALFVYESSHEASSNSQTSAVSSSSVRPRIDKRPYEDNLDKMHRCQLPTLIIHGTDDTIIPLTDAIALFEACPSDDKQIIPIKGAGHNDLLFVGFSQYCNALRSYLNRFTH